MKIYLKNKTTSEISKVESKNFSTLSRGVRDLNDEATQEEADVFILQESKDKTITQIKTNRNNANLLPLNSIQALEIIDNGDGSFTTSENSKNFLFNVAKTNTPLTESSNIINSALRGKVIRYSCAIVEGENIRKGYVEIDVTVAENIENHLIVRGQDNVALANSLEDEVNACTTIEEVEAIDINFS